MLSQVPPGDGGWGYFQRISPGKGSESRGSAAAKSCLSPPAPTLRPGPHASAAFWVARPSPRWYRGRRHRGRRRGAGRQVGGLRSAAEFTWLAGSPGGGGGRRGSRRALEQQPSVTAARQRGRASGPGGPRLPLRKAAPAASSGTRLPKSGARAAERRPGTPRRPSGFGAARARWVFVAGAGGAARGFVYVPRSGDRGDLGGTRGAGLSGAAAQVAGRWQPEASLRVGARGCGRQSTAAGAGTRRVSRCGLGPGPRPGLPESARPRGGGGGGV